MTSDQLNFNDTETAFAHKSNRELVHDFEIYRLINQGWLVRMGTRTASRMIKWGIKAPIVLGMRSTVYDVFCGGETLSLATKKINQLYAYEVQSILDYGVEGKETEEDFERTTNAITQAIFFAKNYDAVDIVSSKFTGLIPFAILEKLHGGEELSQEEKEIYGHSKERIYGLAKLASDHNVSLFVDAEESWIQQPLDDLTFDLMLKYNKEKPIIYNTIQLYRKDRLEFFKRTVEQAKKAGIIYAVKLVRGAYMEKEKKRAEKMNYPNPIQNSKTDTDRDYNEALKFAIDNIEHVAICVATHNEESTMLATQLMHEKKLPTNHDHIHFSQLLGMSDNITFNLAKAGYHASKYMPYGPVKDVIPYLIRRAQENTSVAGQMGRELKLLKEEIRRRRLFVL
ncbi:MAG: Proline dehydrogenase [Bacteroidota bacterium]|nr:Proline dehydrogenase [Bacteroidota bacterium]